MLAILFNSSLLGASCKTSNQQYLTPPPVQKQQCLASAAAPSASISVDDQYSWQNHLFIDIAYTYWYAGEEGLSLGRSGDFLIGDDPLFNSTTTLLSQPFHYQSGFEVGAGWRKNDWILGGKYIWVRNNTSQHSLAPEPSPSFGTGVWLIAPWFLQVASDGGSLSGTEITSDWHLAMDIADLTLGNLCIQQDHLAVTATGGLRAAWIRQNMNIALTETPGILIPLPPQPIHSTNSSHSWSIGPKFKTEARGLLGFGFRVEANIATSLLLTTYTKIFHREDGAMLGAVPENIYVKETNRTALRPVVECGLGLGWEKNLCSNKYHVDFSADYNFMYWWNQNMMRELLNNLWGKVPANGDLYLHGLTVSGRFDF